MIKSPYVNQLDPLYVARKLCEEMDIDLHSAINLEYILDKLNIVIKYKEIKPNILGACKSKGLNRMIVINPNINYIGKERFTIAHEIGHLCLHHSSAYCTEKDINMNITKKDKEIQANLFASELLLPYFPLLKILRKKDLTIELIQDISDKYVTSLTSTAIRLVSICNDPVAIFYHKDNRIKWAIKSPECSYEIERLIVNPTSIASKFNDSKTINAGYVDISSWFVDVSDNVDCFEETIYFNNLNSYLTIAKIEENDY